MNALRTLRLVGLLEGRSLLCLLFVAMPLKYLYGWPLGVRVLGGIHGLLFLVFVSSVYHCADELRWPLRRSLLACASAVLPAGTLLFNRWLTAQDHSPRAAPRVEAGVDGAHLPQRESAAPCSNSVVPSDVRSRTSTAAIE